MKYLVCLLFFLTLAFTASAQLIINEVCYDPSNAALEGDANGDGVYNQVEDEFLELVNTSTTPINLSKYKVYDKVIASGLKTLRHTMGDTVILPGRAALVIFGGGTPRGTFGGAFVVVDRGTTGLSLGNSGEIVIIEDSLGNVVDSINTNDLSDNPNESYTRNPDFTGAFVQHASARAGVLFSPGLKVDGTPFEAATTNRKAIKDPYFQFYPNPSNGIFHLKGNSEGTLLLKVTDYTGRVIISNPNSTTLDLSSNPSGMYSVFGISKGVLFCQKLILQ